MKEQEASRGRVPITIPAVELGSEDTSLDLLGISPLVHETLRDPPGEGWGGSGEAAQAVQPQLLGPFIELTATIVTVPRPSAPVLVAGTKG